MKSTAHIPVYDEIEDYYQAIKCRLKPCLPNFDILSFEEIGDAAEVKFAPPLRKDFYQIVFKLNPANSNVSLNTARIVTERPILIFQSPHHVYAWRRNEELKGFTLFFKANFVEDYQKFEREFRFFRLTENNLLPVTDGQLDDVRSFFAKMHDVKNSGIRLKEKILPALLTAFLYLCESLFREQREIEIRQPKNVAIVQNFLQLINKFYLERKQVEQYAELLNLTANHLNEVVKAGTGQTARQHIVRRVLLEAENLLCHTDLNAAEISYLLGFDEPTNFSKFFKRGAGVSPLEFRKRNSA